MELEDLELTGSSIEKLLEGNLERETTSLEILFQCPMTAGLKIL